MGVDYSCSTTLSWFDSTRKQNNGLKFNIDLDLDLNLGLDFGREREAGESSSKRKNS